MEYTILDLLVQLVEHGASDLHLTAGVPPTLRIYGKLVRLDYKPLTPDDVRELAFSMIREDQRKKFELERELDFGYSQKGIGRFRCNLGFQRESVYCTMRAISEKMPTMEELLLPPIMKEVIMLPRGLVLVTGPTGSGKSTSLAAMLNVINETKDLHIVTLEDPIEFVHQHKRCNVNQREVGRDTLSFSGALKRVLRQDPDVILVGEMRDLETIATAITAAETGHLVFATLHTNNAPLTIDRIVDVFPSEQQDQIRAQLANTLQCIMSQQLLPLADGGGRVAAFEVMLNIPAIRNLIREKKEFQIHSVMMTHSKMGMQTMDQNLRDRYVDRLITLEVAMAHAGNVGNLQRLISAAAASGVKSSRELLDRETPSLDGSSLGV
ncbi:MAG: type IV pili twitching motility protein PilT [Planctomycetales bacterium 4484_113]|nr:MAG: type IV pili twitching motility protein PilT [Planctomycetales bacterium 4484_113]